VIMFHAH